MTAVNLNVLGLVFNWAAYWCFSFTPCRTVLAEAAKDFCSSSSTTTPTKPKKKDLTSPRGLASRLSPLGPRSKCTQAGTSSKEKRMTSNKSKQDDQEQAKRFIDTAREREADETEEGADQAFKAARSPRS